MLAPFMKNPLKAVLKGVTNDLVDPSVSDIVRDYVKVKIMIHSALYLKIAGCFAGGPVESHGCSTNEEVWYGWGRSGNEGTARVNPGLYL